MNIFHRRLVNTPIVRLGSVFTLMILLGSLTCGVAYASSTETIQGVVVNGTAGATVPKGLTITLDVVNAKHQVLAEQSVSTDTAGRFSFTSVPVDPQATYVVSTDYAGVPYTTMLPKPSPNARQAPTARLEIFESTNSAAHLRVDSVDWLLGTINPRTEQALILETLTVTNGDDRTFVGDHRGDPGSATPGILPRTLRLRLPDGASDFHVELGLDPSFLLPVAGGYVDTEPVLPGQHQIAFTFRIGYSEGVAELRTQLTYPTAKVHFLAPNGLGFRSDHLANQGVTKLQGHNYRVLGADNLSPDTVVTVDVVGLPEIPADRLNPTMIRIGGLIVIALGILGAVYLSLRRPKTHSGQSLDQRHALLLAMAELDEQYAAGKLDESSYQRERAEKKRRLVDLMLGKRRDITQRSAVGNRSL